DEKHGSTFAVRAAKQVVRPRSGCSVEFGSKVGSNAPPINAGRNPMRSLTHVIALAALLCPLPAIAQQQPSGGRTAPPVVGDSLDGSTSVPAETSTVLFNGAVPRDGFMVQPRGNDCVINDHGSASFITGPNGP